MQVAVIGLGTMGAPMAANLLKAGYSVVVHNRTRSREIPLAGLGAATADSPRQACARADAVLVCVSDTPDVEEVLLDPERGALSSLRRGGLVIDCSTISPAATRRFAERARESGAGYVDAPVSGGSEGAVRGTLAIMCGGSPEDFARARPLLEVLGKSVVHVGPPGAGQTAKAVNQVVIAGTYASVAEGISLAMAAGMDPRRVVEAIGGGAARSWVLENRGGNMIDDSYPLGFRMRLHRKDIRIALEAAREAGGDLPLTRFVANLEDELIAMGFGEEDVSAIARAARRSCGLPGGPP